MFPTYFSAAAAIAPEKISIFYALSAFSLCILLFCSYMNVSVCLCNFQTFFSSLVPLAPFIHSWILCKLKYAIIYIINFLFFFHPHKHTLINVWIFLHHNNIHVYLNVCIESATLFSLCLKVKKVHMTESLHVYEIRGKNCGCNNKHKYK